ncbi:hypothetical protein JX265_009505 [Neoarthrinium moseri]|uniref:Nephrocystin 3-like N-terminal domain-containing protein n=1 Tax=Neoarthrinium moseri TaxID=1658444 RepID=A0A9Q0ALH3_9PEZI|nr:hypothetical protein JX265_009505 [Neoarthrinium moseri]
MSDLGLYTVGWICAVETELVAAASFLDEEHDEPEQLPVHDNNAYVLGRIGKHNVVIAALPDGQYGLVTAATVARDMVRSFPNVRIGLMVGIGGGAPSQKHDVHLGDVVVSSPGPGSGGVFQYDYGKTIQDSSFVVTAHHNQPPQFLLAALANLKAQYKPRGHDLEQAIENVLQNNRRLQAEYRKPDPSTDRLYAPDYTHAGTKEQECTAMCDVSQLAKRPERTEEQESPMIHHGIIASANQLMKDATLRDRLSAEKDILCFEIEAAGLMNHFPCLVIRGICDYSDTHKNKVWQGYAAMAAAAYAKDLLRKVAPNKVEAERKLIDLLSSGSPHPSSGFWPASHPRRGLKTQPKSFLWLYGIPGCGKTILTSTAIEDLQTSPGHSAALLYFYFDFTDTQKQQFENTIRSLVWQLYHKNERARKDLGALYASCNSGRDQPRIDRLQETFAKMVQESGEVWVVLDALDECTVRDKLLFWLENVRTGKQNVHLLATSRPERDIRSAIEKFSYEEERIPIQDDLIEADIRSYVHAQIREDKSFEIWNTRPDIQAEMETSLVSKANGMFRWVWCQLTALGKCRDPIALRKALISLPKTLDETYAQILTNIPPECFDHTVRILQFLTYSERPLRLAEAVDAIAVNIGADIADGPRFNAQDRMPVPGDIVGYCSGLVVLVRRTDPIDDDLIIEEIQLAHFSVKDYLISDRLERHTAHHLQATAARSLIAEVCLTYLLELEHNADIAWIKDTFPFAQYSARYWATHALVGEHNSESVLKLASELLVSRSHLEGSYRLYDPDQPWDDAPSSENIPPALYYASLHGLSRCVRLLLDEGADVNT